MKYMLTLVLLWGVGGFKDPGQCISEVDLDHLGSKDLLRPIQKYPSNLIGPKLFNMIRASLSICLNNANLETISQLIFKV